MKYPNNIEPENCSDMQELRIEIDNMDRDIITIQYPISFKMQNSACCEVNTF